MTDLALQVQLEALARVLEVEVSDVEKFAHLGIDGLRNLRKAVSNSLYDSDAEMFARVSKLAPLVPDAVVSKVAHAAVPPLVAGRMAGALGLAHPDRPIGLLRRMNPDYLAAAAAYVDPRAVAVLAPGFEEDPMALIPAAKKMLAQGQYAVSASFLEFATPALIRAFAEELDDLDALIECVAYVDTDESLDKVITHVPQDRIRAILHQALGNDQGVVAALSVASRISPEQARRVSGIIFTELDDAQLDALVARIAALDSQPQLEVVLGLAETDVAARVRSMPHYGG